MHQKNLPENLPEGTTILDMASATFGADFLEAVGAKPGDTLEIQTPQFTRTDGRTVEAVAVPGTRDPIDWEALPGLDSETLTNLGFQVWDVSDEKGIHWLFPVEWYDIIPEGYPIINIFEKAEVFKKGETPDDARYGALAFGFIGTNKEPVSLEA